MNKNELIRFNENTIKTLHVSNERRYYIYALIDPKDNFIFYIGKGTENRVFSHEKSADELSENENQKIKKIQSITSRKNNKINYVKKEIISFGLTEQEAFVAESVLIEALKHYDNVNLKNIVSGHHATDIMDVNTFNTMHGAVPIDISDISKKILLISIGATYNYDLDPKETYEIARGYWAIDMKRAHNVDYVLAVYHQIVVGVYKNLQWHHSSETKGLPKYSGKTQEEIEKDIKSDRKWFSGEILDENNDIYNKFFGKELHGIKFSPQNPLRYINC